MFIHQILFNTLAKITGSRNVGQQDRHLLCGQTSVYRLIIGKYGVYTRNALQDIRQKSLEREVSLTQISCVLHWSER